MPTLETNPIGRRGTVIPHDLPPMTAEQERIRQMVDAIGTHVVGKTVDLKAS